jgi:hypothetical protein
MACSVNSPLIFAMFFCTMNPFVHYSIIDRIPMMYLHKTLPRTLNSIP